MGLLVILLASALARPLDTADASTVGVGMMQVEAGSELAPSTLPQLPVGISVGLSDRVDVITGVAADGVRPVSGGLGTKWLLRDGSARGGPGLAVEAFADVLAEEAAVPSPSVRRGAGSRSIFPATPRQLSTARWPPAGGWPLRCSLPHRCGRWRKCA